MTAIKRIKDQPGGVWAESRGNLVASEFSQSGRAIYIQPYLEEVMKRISADLEEQGFPVGQNDLFRIASGFRTQEEQDELWQRALDKYGDPDIADDFVARVSAHQTGAVIDINLGFPIKSEHIGQIRATDAYTAWEDLAYNKYKMAPYDVEPWHWECGDACKENIEEILQGESESSQEFDWNKRGEKTPVENTRRRATKQRGTAGSAVLLGAAVLLSGAGALLWMHKRGMLKRKRR